MVFPELLVTERRRPRSPLFPANTEATVLLHQTHLEGAGASRNNTPDRKHAHAAQKKDRQARPRVDRHEEEGSEHKARVLLHLAKSGISRLSFTHRGN